MYLTERDAGVRIWNVEVIQRPDGDIDSDGDGVLDANDAFPTDPAASVDTDGDGMPDDWNDGASAIVIGESPLTVDDDDDNDGIPDVDDQDPLYPTSTAPRRSLTCHLVGPHLKKTAITWCRHRLGIRWLCQ